MGESLPFPLKLAQKHFYLFYKVKNIDTYKVVPRYFLSFETFVLFAQAPDEGNHKLTGIYSGHTWVCVMVKLILL